MFLATRVRSLRAVAFASALACLTLPALAQEISDTHLKAARDAIASLNATDIFDGILPGAAGQLKQQLISRNPDLQELITTTVDEKVLGLVSRRADLEREAALAYARVFTEEELKQMAAFFSSPTGQKLISDGAIANREVAKAAEIWQRGIARDLAVSVAEVIVKEKPDADTSTTPQQASPDDQPAAPAASGN
ncbi:MAG: DUF2059 domain-containing protein [Methylobacterium mesophilicum]|nr:DUF2059 domain-containing protein [Methylobacterium mesophilicum]